MISRLSSVLLALVASLALGSSVRGQCSGDINGDGRVDGIDLATVLAQWGTCPPTIASVVPAHGSVLGGTTITITGTGLLGTTGVTIGGVPCTGVTALSGTQVRATTPAGSVGEAMITITTPVGSGTSPSLFSYVLQSITSVSPSSGGFSGGTPITITGQYLSGTTAVRIGGVPATNVVAVNSTTVTAVTPPGSVGVVDVVVSGAKGNVALEGGYIYLAANVPLWATCIDVMPDPNVVTSEFYRQAIAATGWAWRVRDNQTQMELVLIPPGTFNMGCSPSNQYGCHSQNLPVRAVTLSNPFYLGRFEVKQSEWTEVMETNTSWFQGTNYPDAASRPVERVSWFAAKEFIDAAGFRLPTEAEWEYAYRAGTSTAYHGFSGHPNGTNDDSLRGVIAWYNSNSGGQTHPTGQKPANGFGLHDMSGNVDEWVNDWWDPIYYQSAPALNPPGPPVGVRKVYRGGNHWGSMCLGYMRSEGIPNEYYNWLGFRVARNP